MQLKHLTPEILRAAQTRLWSGDPDKCASVTRISPHPHRFMCHAVAQVAGAHALAEFEGLLDWHGATACYGGALYFTPREYAVLDVADRQAVRFMFLEFLALSLES